MCLFLEQLCQLFALRNCQAAHDDHWAAIVSCAILVELFVYHLHAGAFFLHLRTSPSSRSGLSHVPFLAPALFRQRRQATICENHVHLDVAHAY